jgi:hypothetical protein
MLTYAGEWDLIQSQDLTKSVMALGRGNRREEGGGGTCFTSTKVLALPAQKYLLFFSAKSTALGRGNRREEGGGGGTFLEQKYFLF